MPYSSTYIELFSHIAPSIFCCGILISHACAQINSWGDEATKSPSYVGVNDTVLEYSTNHLETRLARRT